MVRVGVTVGACDMGRVTPAITASAIEPDGNRPEEVARCGASAEADNVGHCTRRIIDIDPGLFVD
jgi:hypothetical protein